MVSKVSSWATGGSFTAFAVMVKVWVIEVSSPPLVVPPSSLMYTLTVAEPKASSAGVKLSLPLESRDG